jgi:hypothetical protein
MAALEDRIRHCPSTVNTDHPGQHYRVLDGRSQSACGSFLQVSPHFGGVRSTAHYSRKSAECRIPDGQRLTPATLLPELSVGLFDPQWRSRYSTQFALQSVLDDVRRGKSAWAGFPTSGQD